VRERNIRPLGNLLLPRGSHEKKFFSFRLSKKTTNNDELLQREREQNIGTQLFIEREQVEEEEEEEEEEEVCL